MAGQGAVTFQILPRWTDVEGDPASAHVRMAVGPVNLTTALNMFSQSVDQAPHLSALPLARWLAGNWWRLQWEPRPLGPPSLDWRMSHEVPAAGGGFIWPRLTIASDGEEVELRSEASPPGGNEVLRYLTTHTATVQAGELTAAIDDFLSLTIERLAMRRQGDDLAGLWRCVQEERLDGEASRARRLEAILGFDPDEAPAQLMDGFRSLEHETGVTAAAEIAAVIASKGIGHPRNLLDAIRDEPYVPMPALESGFGPVPQASTPAERGRQLASAVRRRLGLDPWRPVRDAELAGFLGLRPESLHGDASPIPPPVGLMRIEERCAAIRMRSRQPTGRRFEAARFLSEAIAHPCEKWHVAADTRTARQKVQRAFAAEFLAPAAAVSEYLGGDMSTDAIEGAAEHFDVSSWLMASHLANLGIIKRDHPAVPR